MKYWNACFGRDILWSEPLRRVMTDLIPSDRAAGAMAALDVFAMLESLVQATGAPYAFLACQSANEPLHANIIAASRWAAELFPSKIPLEGEFWRELARTGERWIESPAGTHSAADPVFAVVNGTSVAALSFYLTAGGGRNFLVLVSDAPLGDRVLLRSCMLLVAGRLTHQSHLQLPALDVDSPSGGQEVMAARLREVVAEARRDAESFYLLLTIDLDGFTAISASYGQELAARLLRAVGERFRGCLRPSDTIARYGCDEFSILVQCSSESSLATLVCERVRQQLAAPFPVDGYHIAVSASVGIARVHPQHESGDDVRRDADAAVHEAKMLGGNQCVLFDEGMHEKTKARLRLEAELRHAVDRGEFRLHYQPIVSVATGRLVSLEALIRWQHPVRGCLPPSEFLDALVATGLMPDVGRYVVREACRQAAEWRRDPTFDVSISTNVSPRQLLEPRFLDDVTTMLADADAKPSWIAMEITEDISLGDGDAALKVLQELRARGIHVRIDDFGTGFSSLSYLQWLPVKGLKIDRAFLQELETDTRHLEIVGAIIRLSHVLGLDVVAEGVERHEQVEVLRALGCDFAQGFLISKPMPAAEVPLFRNPLCN
jgi:diguanylate cyclase (GGDEF)-like protein